MKKIVYLWRWYGRLITARYRINDFLGSDNGTRIVQELSLEELQQRKKIAQEQLVTRWLFEPELLKEWLSITFIYQNTSVSDRLLVKVFDEALRVPYDFFREYEVEGIIYIQVATALMLAGYDSQSPKNLTVVITEQGSAIFSSLRAYEYYVCRSIDWDTDLHTKPEPLPKKKLPYEAAL